MKYQTMRIDHLNHLYIEASAGEVRFTVNGDALVVEPVLSEKKPRIKVEYVKCNYGNEHYSAGCDLFTCKPLFVLSKDGNYYPIKRQDKAVKASQDGRIYERIETTMTEREEFIDAAIECIDDYSSDDPNYFKQWFESMYDSGKFKLVK